MLPWNRSAGLTTRSQRGRAPHDIEERIGKACILFGAILHPRGVHQSETGANLERVDLGWEGGREENEIGPEKDCRPTVHRKI